MQQHCSDERKDSKARDYSLRMTEVEGTKDSEARDHSLRLTEYQCGRRPEVERVLQQAILLNFIIFYFITLYLSRMTPYFIPCASSKTKRVLIKNIKLLIVLVYYLYTTSILDTLRVCLYND